MTLNLSMPRAENDLKPRITVIGVGGAGCNAVGNMIKANLEGVEFVVANTDAQSLGLSRAERRIQLGVSITNGLGAGARPDIGRAAAEEAIDLVMEHLQGSHMVFITAGMGGGTGTGAGPVIARAAREQGLLTVGVITKPFHFEGHHRMAIAEEGIQELQQFVDTLIVIPNQNLFRVANEKTTFADAFKMADNVLYSGVRGVTDLMVMPGLINLDFADIRTVMGEMGKAMMGTGEASGERRAIEASEAAIANPLLEDVSMKGAHGLLINITGGLDMTLFEVDEAANRVRDEVDDGANIIFGSTFDETMEGVMRVSIVATGIDADIKHMPRPATIRLVDRKPEPVVRAEIRPAAEAMAATAAEPMPAAAAEPMSAAAAEPMSATAAAPAMDYGAANVAEAGHAVAAATAVADASDQAPPEPVIDQPFIAPRPVEPEGAAQPAAAEPVTAAAGGDPAPQRRRNLGLLQKVAGAARNQIAARSETSPTPPEPAASSGHDRDVGAPPAQSSFGGLDPADRPGPQPAEDDLLEIPAFLRRQAN